MISQLLGQFRRFRHHLSNFSAFSALQIASYLIPIVTLPYFARTLGIAALGQIAIASAVGLGAAVVMDYGVQLSGTRLAAKNAGDPPLLATYLNATTTLKLWLIAPFFVALWVASWFVPNIAQHIGVFNWALVSAAALCLFPQWLFQGLSIVPVAARIVVSTRLLAAVAAILLVQRPADAYVVPMTQAIGGMIALALAAVALRQRFNIRLRPGSRRDLRAILRDNWKLFSATVWGAAYAHGAIIIMGLLLTTVSIGYYSIAQRVSQAFVSMFNIAAQTLFPAFVRSFADDNDLFAKQVGLYVGFAAGCSALSLLLVFVLREPLYLFLAGQHSDFGLTIFSIWLLASFFTVISVSLNPIMVAMHLDGRMATIYRLTGLGFLMIAPLAAYRLDATGMALTMLAVEAFMASYCLLTVARLLRQRTVAITNARS